MITVCLDCFNDNDECIFCPNFVIYEKQWQVFVVIKIIKYNR